MRPPERPPRCGGGGRGNVRLCLPFSCVSTPIYGPSCFLSLIHSSPSVFDLLLTWCCFPWLFYVFISPEFFLSLCPPTRLCSCVSCVPSLKSHYSFYLSSPVSFPQHDSDRLTDPKKMEERRHCPQLILVCPSRGSFDAARGSPSPPFVGSQRPFAVHVSPPFTGSQRPFVAHVSLPATASPPTDAHVPLGVLVAYEGMSWSPTPESPSPPLVPSRSASPRRHSQEPAPRQRPPVPAPRQSPPVPAPRKCSQVSPLVPSSSPEHPWESEPPERPRESAPPERPRESAPPERPRESALPERPQELVPSSSPLPPLVPSSSHWPTLVPSSSPGPPLVPSSSPLPPLVPSSSPSSPLALSSSPSTPPERPPASAPPERPPEMMSFPNNFFGGGYPPWPMETPDSPWPMDDLPWPPESPDPPWPPDLPWPPKSPNPPRHLIRQGCRTPWIRHGCPRHLIRYGRPRHLIRHGRPISRLRRGSRNGHRPGGHLSGLKVPWGLQSAHPPMHLIFIHINIPHLCLLHFKKVMLCRLLQNNTHTHTHTHTHHYKPVDSTLSLSFIELATFDRSEELWPHRTHKK